MTVMPSRLSLFPRRLENELPGDYLLRKARRCLLFLAITLLISSPLYIWFGAAWTVIRPLSGIIFIAGSLLFAVGLMIGPIGCLLFGLMGLFLRVESRFAPRLAKVTAADRVAVGLGMLISFAPALAACYPPLKALMTGSIHYKFPSQEVLRSADSLGYWQGVAFWLMGAATLAILAALYWRSRWRKLKKQ